MLQGRPLLAEPGAAPCQSRAAPAAPHGTHYCHSCALSDVCVCLGERGAKERKRGGCGLNEAQPADTPAGAARGRSCSPWEAQAEQFGTGLSGREPRGDGAQRGQGGAAETEHYGLIAPWSPFSPALRCSGKVDESG